MIIVIMECLSGNTLSFDDVKLTETVLDLKRRIYKATGFECPIRMQRLIRGAFNPPRHYFGHIFFLCFVLHDMMLNGFICLL
jgi:hypothetical protein